MRYKSTRDQNNIVTASQAILQGLAVDGGLFVPTEFPSVEHDWNSLKEDSYQDLAFKILSIFIDDFSPEQLRHCIDSAYDEKFDTDLIAPIVEVDGHYHLELFHGATIAFKDMALSILPYLMKTAAEINHNDNEIIILTATSGDTGKAAMAGFSNVPGTKIIVFYPKGGVSSIQEQQMVTQTGNNTYVVAVRGNFDDAQTKVKELFNDEALKEELSQDGRQFSSANSMNIGRLVPQVVYYFYAYAQLIKQGKIEVGQKINFSVPTGNFGNILAAYYAKQIGLPINKLLCASNDNTVLYDFFQSGTYDKNREFKLTTSPSMDILVSSNFERLVYHAINDNTELLKDLMNQLNTKGSYTVPEEFQTAFKDFIGEFADMDETAEEIKEVYERTDYVMDPHTAVASKAWRKANAKGLVDANSVIVSTASPYKFPEAVLNALDIDTSKDSDEDLLNKLHAICKVPFPPAIDGLLEAKVLHDTVIEVDEMKTIVQEIAKK